MVDSGQNALELIERVYGAAVEPDRWTPTLTAIGEALGGVEECLYVEDRATRFSVLSAPRKDPAFVHSFRNDWMTLDHRRRGNLLAERLLRVPSGMVVDLRSVIHVHEFQRTDFYNEWWKPQGLGPCALSVNLATNDGLWATCGIHANRRLESFGQRETRLLATLAPHLLRAVQVQRELWRANLDVELSRAVPISSAHGALLTDEQGRVVFADAAARELFRTPNALCLEKGALGAIRPNLSAALRRLIWSCSDSSAIERGGTLSLPRSRGAAVGVTVAPFCMRPEMRARLWPGAIEPTALLLFSDELGERRSRVETLQRAYGLTPAEAAFALEIVKGDGRKAAALRLGISVSTARTHLTHIFEKTGVHRQAELVALLAGDPAR